MNEKNATLAELKAEAEQIYQEYEAHFAGKPRGTRRLELLDELIGRLETVIGKGRSALNGSGDPGLRSVLDMATDNLEIYRNEHKAIEDVRGAGPEAEQAASLANWANMTFARYRRHFAGKNRLTRDLGLMDEMIEDLESVQAAMTTLLERWYFEGLEKDLEVVSQNLQMYRDERKNIVDSRRDQENDEYASVLGTLANDQFAVYRDHFADKPRVSRRPGLLKRIIANLEHIESSMRRLRKRGYLSLPNTRNVGIVQQNLKTFRAELDAIEEERASVSLEDLSGHLGAAANAAMAEYGAHFAGIDRKTCDLVGLSLLCDLMLEIARQMHTISQQETIDDNEENLRIVLDTLGMYENEYQLVAQAQGAV